MVFTVNNHSLHRESCETSRPGLSESFLAFSRRSALRVARVNLTSKRNGRRFSVEKVWLKISKNWWFKWLPCSMKVSQKVYSLGTYHCWESRELILSCPAHQQPQMDPCWGHNAALPESWILGVNHGVLWFLMVNTTSLISLGMTVTSIFDVFPSPVGPPNQTYSSWVVGQSPSTPHFADLGHPEAMPSTGPSFAWRHQGVFFSDFLAKSGGTAGSWGRSIVSLRKTHPVGAQTDQVAGWSAFQYDVNVV